MTIHRIYKLNGGYICRRCINDDYHIHLRHRDCRYLPVQSTCPACHGTRNLVVGVRLSGQLKLLFKH
ncbi:MAG: hypothetical protein IJ083_09760 [Clostridia bacterium]|nr:hypothetical protein [Clostridia bacterium]